MIDLSIVVVNYNGARFIAECFESLFGNGCRYSYEVIVVDNASSDDSLAILRGYGEKIRLIENPENVGFSRGNNQCIDLCQGRYMLLLNNDTIVKPKALDTMVDFLERRPDVGALSPKLLNGDGSVQVQGSWSGSFRYYAKKARPISFIAGAAMLTRTALMKEIGGLDENLFFYNDDIDFCKQLSRRKIPIYYLPEAEVTHFGGLSTKFRHAAAVVDGYKGSLYLCRKFYPKWAFYLYRILMFFEVALKLLIHSVLGILLRKNRDFSRAYVRILGVIFSGRILAEER